MRRRDGGTAGLSLLELMIVLAILALVATMAVPRLTGQLGRAKSQAAQIEIQSIAEALEYFRLELGRYPTKAEGLTALIAAPAGLPAWNGPYLEGGSESLLDPWGAPYRYDVTAGRGFDVISLGADGQPGGTQEARDLARK